MTEYRIRWDRIHRSHYNGTATVARMCIAEKAHHFLGIKFWWPLINGEWRFYDHEAELDIERDLNLSLPLPDNKYFELKEVTKSA